MSDKKKIIKNSKIDKKSFRLSIAVSEWDSLDEKKKSMFTKMGKRYVLDSPVTFFAGPEKRGHFDHVEIHYGHKKVGYFGHLTFHQISKKSVHSIHRHGGVKKIKINDKFQTKNARALCKLKGYPLDES